MHVHSRSTRSKTVKVTDYPSKVVKVDFAAFCVVEIAETLDSKILGKSNLKTGCLLVKRPEEGLLAGLWEFPSVLVEEPKTDTGTGRRTMDKYLKTLFGLDVGKNCNTLQREEVAEHLHVFSHIRLHMHVELLTLESQRF